MVKKVDLDNIKIDINSIYTLEAPVESNCIIGKMKIMVKDEVIESKDIYITNRIEKKNMWNYFFECIGRFVKL